MDDRALRLALEALLDEPTLKSAHRGSIERGLADLRAQRLPPDEHDYLCYLIEHYGQPSPSPDPVAALIAAFQDKLPHHDPAAVATAIHALVAGDAAQLDGKLLALTIERRGQTQIANLAERNVVIGDLNQLDISVQIPIPDARFDHLLQAAFQRQTHERITKAAQQIESDRLLNLRLQGFVGRVNELAAIRQHIATMRPTGGYVLIKGVAGEGKSSIIAKLIQEAGITQTPHHFIALTTGREYQLGLLRAVVAQLILKHNLTVSYFPEESYPAMKAEFVRILNELSKHGIVETIYLDGLDQLQPEIDGSRDFSFLPPQPPPGIVIVLGSRPDDTLNPLEILHRVDYDLPPLSEIDGMILWQSVLPDVSDELLYGLYVALNGNALFVHLAADTMRNQSMVDSTNLIRQIEQNPSNLFGITLDRIKNRSEHRWPTIWRPMVAILLGAQEPLLLDVLGDLLEQDHATMQDAVRVLGGLVSQGIDQRITLHHLMFRDYLAASVFNTREVKHWHQRLADWCAKDEDAIWTDHIDAIEQARRVYARHHYVTHLALAENWTTLWKVLDTGDYGEHKTRFALSTRLYALDLDRGRESAINAGRSVDEHIRNLPRLWKYSLLRTSLTSRNDQWPTSLFVILARSQRTQEALERVELLSNPYRQIQVWGKLLPWCHTDQQSVIVARMKQVVGNLSGFYRSISLAQIAIAYTVANQFDVAMKYIDQSILSINSIPTAEERAYTLAMIAKNVAPIVMIAKNVASIDLVDVAHIREEVMTIVNTNPINKEWIRISVFANLIQATAAIGQVDQATQLLDHVIENMRYENQNRELDHAYITLVNAVIALGHIEHALDIANCIVEDFQYVTALIESVQILITIDQPMHILRLLDQAILRIKSMKKDGRQIRLLVDIFEVAISCGHSDRAAFIIHFIENDRRYIHHYKDLPTSELEHAAVKVFDKAITATYSMSIAEIRDSVITHLAQTSVSMGDINTAMIIANKMSDEKKRANTIIELTHYAEPIRHNGQPLSIVKPIDQDWKSNGSLVALVQTADSTGQIDSLLTIANAIDDSQKRIDVLKTFAHIVAFMGSIDQAIKLTYFINRESERIEVCKVITQIAVSMGYIDQAMTIANSIEQSWNRTDVIIGITQMVSSAGILLPLIHNAWIHTSTCDNLWNLLKMINPLLITHAYLAIEILGEEGWVNEQLKRLG